MRKRGGVLIRVTMTSRKLWTCTKCRRQFVNRNMPHSCGRYSVEAFLNGKSQFAISLYKHFVAIVRQCGPVRMAPDKTRICFQVRMIFAAVNKLNDRGLDAHIPQALTCEPANQLDKRLLQPRTLVTRDRLKGSTASSDLIGEISHRI